VDRISRTPRRANLGARSDHHLVVESTGGQDAALRVKRELIHCLVMSGLQEELPCRGRVRRLERAGQDETKSYARCRAHAVLLPDSPGIGLGYQQPEIATTLGFTGEPESSRLLSERALVIVPDRDVL
jgi:hypothetical protein